MSERKEGWYWVKTGMKTRKPHKRWVAAEWYHEPLNAEIGEPSHVWLDANQGEIEPESKVIEIGPRIPTPDEGWQCVPKNPEALQIEAGCEASGDCERRGECYGDCHCSPVAKIYRAMLSAAPQPGDNHE